MPQGIGQANSGEGAAGAPLFILTLLHSFEPGGVERVALRLCGAWAAAGRRTGIVLGRRDGPLAGELPPGVELHAAPPSRFAAPFESLWLVPHLVRTVRRLRPDVLFCPGNTYSIVAVLARLWLGRDCPPILCKVSNCVTRGDLPWLARAAYRRWLRWQAATFAGFVGMAEPMRCEIETAFAVGPERVAIIHDPALNRLAEEAAPAPRRDRAARAGRIRYLAVGRLVPQKNFALLIRAFAAVASRGARLTIVGEGPERGRLERLSRDLGLAGRVYLPGHSRRVGDHFADADMFVLSSDYEGVPAVVIEALAAGLPVVATDCSVSMADLLGGGDFGMLVPRGDAARLSAAMLTARTTVWPRAAMRESTRRFTIGPASKAYLGALARAAAGETLEAHPA